MKILKLPSYYYPEQISSSHLTKDLEEVYQKAGFELSVYAPTPTRGVSAEVREKYKKIKYEERLDGAIKVHRFSMFREPKNAILRAIRYSCVQWKQYFRATKEEGISVISSGSTPPTAGILCAKVKEKLSKKYRRNVPFIFNLQDVFPESLVTAGLTHRGSLIYRLGDIIANYTYRNADKIIVISDDIKNTLLEKGVLEEKIELIYNWIDTNSVTPVSRQENHLFDELELNRDSFYITYAGNLGKAQGIDTIIEAAEKLIGNENITFVIFGGGVEAENYRRIVSNKKLKNVLFYPLQPQERVSEVYSLGDASIVSCKKGTAKGALPSKTWSIMATGTPVLLSFDIDSELQRIVETNQVGLFSDAGDAETLTHNILELYLNSKEKEEMGAKARLLVENSFSKEKCTSQYLSLLLNVTENNQTIR